MPSTSMRCARMFALVLLAAYACGAKAEPWTEVLNLDCQGNARMFSNHLLSTSANVKDVIDALQYVSDRLHDRVKDVCPSVGNQEFARDFFPSFPLLLNQVKGKNRDQTTACGNSFRWKAANIFDKNLFKGLGSFQLPTTCSSETLMAGEGCLLKMPFSTTADSYLQVAVDTCDAKLVRPFVSITCVGPLCASLAKPCDSQSQCGGLNCASIDGFLDNRLSEYSADLRSGAESLKLFNPEKDDAACLTSVTGTKGLGLFSSFGGFFRKHYDDVASILWKSTSTMSVCGGDLLSPTKLVKQFVDPLQCPKTFGTNKDLSCGKIVAWDGKLSDGKNVLDNSRKQGTMFTDDASRATCADTENKLTAMFDITCWGRVGLHLGKRLNAFVAVKHMPDILKWLGESAKTLSDCRGDGSAFSTSFFMSKFVPWMPSSILERMTVTTRPSVEKATSVTDGYPQDELMNWMFGDGAGRLQMPSKCTLSQWLSGGDCTLEYSGLSQLLGSDLILRLRMEKCPLNEFMPRLQVDCEGKLCTMLSPATECSADSDCASVASNMKCTDLAKELGMTSAADPIGGILWPKPLPLSSSRWDYSIGFPIYIVSRFNTDSFFGLADGVELFHCTDSAHCNTNRFRGEFNNFLTTHASSQPFDSTKNEAKFCTPDIDRVETSYNNDWTSNQYTVVADTYTVVGLKNPVADMEICSKEGEFSPSPPPQGSTMVTVVGTVSLDGYSTSTFGITEKAAFITGIAKIAKVSPTSVTISVKDARRHLLAGIIVEYTITTTDTSAAAIIANNIKVTPAATVVTEMKAAGLTKVTTTTVTISTTFATVDVDPAPKIVTESAAPSLQFLYAIIIATVTVLATF